ncbi:hypothetical protein KIN20_029916 [Parelaphostrongylus tenuis]|uniref:Uncharacterized protein n=1 Tax=Parelaphostrongylus tenuis TaxID=148309 RepID=A0AAD5R311_PARTN|nr:hypothetical protein KIN20_029916 [Parelaphostrongylus tenuis]
MRRLSVYKLSHSNLPKKFGDNYSSREELEAHALLALGSNSDHGHDCTRDLSQRAAVDEINEVEGEGHKANLLLDADFNASVSEILTAKTSLVQDIQQS